MLMFLLAQSSCINDEISIETDFEYEYYPLSVGNEWTYQSDSIILSNRGTQIDTLKSFIKETISEVLESEVDQKQYKLSRFFKREAQDDWTRINSWTIIQEKTRLIRTEENIRFIKLVFPPKTGLKYNSTTFITERQIINVGGEFIEPYEQWNSQIVSIDEDHIFNGNSVKTQTIVLTDTDIFLEKRYVTETYAKDIGLIKKEMIILDSDGTQPDAPWSEAATKGFYHTLTLIDFK